MTSHQDHEACNARLGFGEGWGRAGTQRIAIRTGTTLNYLLSDQLGSTDITTDANGVKIAELRYKPWGETRANYGTTPTKYTYTGQYSNMSDFGLMFYNARWYDPAIGRFAQADSLVPGGVQGYDRYGYANNNPILYSDPSGHIGLPPPPPCEDSTPNCQPGNGNNGRGSGNGSGGGGGYQSPPHVSADETWDYITSCVEHIGGCYVQGWRNFGSAWSIYWNPNAALWDRVRAYGYAAVWLDAHATAAYGVSVIVVTNIAAAASSIPAIGLKAYTACLQSNACAAIFAKVTGISVYRVWGGGSQSDGRFWTPINPLTSADWATKAALPLENSGEYLSVGTINSMEGITIGTATKIASNPGGLLQYVIDSPEVQVMLKNVYYLIPPIK